MNEVNQLILYLSRTTLFRSGLDSCLIRAAMVFTFFAFSIQKWTKYTAEMLVHLLRHSPVVFLVAPSFQRSGRRLFPWDDRNDLWLSHFPWLLEPAAWGPGRAWAIVTFIGTRTIIPFLPDGWAQEAGGFPIMTLPLGFLMKDVLFLAASFYLLKHDLTRAAPAITRS